MSSMSLIIPAYNECKLLPRLLDTVDVARERFAGGRDAIEVIVADNASTDETASISSAHAAKLPQLISGRLPPLGAAGAIVGGFTACIRRRRNVGLMTESIYRYSPQTRQ